MYFRSPWPTAASKVTTMSEDSKAIAVLCSHMCTSEGMKPLTAMEWHKIANALNSAGMTPRSLLSLNKDKIVKEMAVSEQIAARIAVLAERSGCVAFEIERYWQMGIKIMTRADSFYPVKLKKKLREAAPPLLYYAGNPEIASGKFVGFVGSRAVAEPDLAFTARVVENCSKKGYSIVSGGAKGVDSEALFAGLNNGAKCAVYVSDTMVRKLRNNNVIDAIIDGNLLMLSAAKPEAGFTVGIAMARNKHIYSQSEGTVVVKSDLSKGGTWNGAVENIKNQWCQTYCWENREYAGNLVLIKKGAIPIDETWVMDEQASTGSICEAAPLTILNCD